MGKMKDFAMDVSAELGFDGMLNDDVLYEGQGRLDGRDVPIAVRTGAGTYIGDSTEFSDTVDRVRRVPRDHVGWQSVIYKGQRYRLGGGIRTQYFIYLNNPIRGVSTEEIASVPP
jgi:hypothetical protein